MAQQQSAAKSEDAKKPEAEMPPSTAVHRGVKLAGEALVAPGTSLLLDGQVLTGGAHLLGGLVAASVLGPVGWLLVAANSYSKSVTGDHLHKQFGGAKGS